MNLTINKILSKNVQLTSNIESVLTSDKIVELINYTKNINPNYVYKKNVFHGLHHSEKVMLFAYLIGKHQGLSYEDLKILADAAIYHDMGREDDTEDVFHGYASSLQVGKVIGRQEFYKNETNKHLLEAIIDMHSVDDKIYRKIFFNHDLDDEEYERFELLAKILKDADALDRLRFGRKSPASLKEKYLRIPYSKELVDFAKDINEIYFKELQIKNKKRIENENEEGMNPCFHSIGFDFFKIEPIISNGILSAQAMKELGLSVPRNFSGGNLENWISVVDGNMVGEGKAFNEFTSNGIGFFCFANKLFSPLDSYGKAIETGYPYNKSEYKDEKYVYSCIKPERIIFLIIPKDYIYRDLRSLSYIYNTLSKDLLIEKISYYILKTKTSITSPNAKELLTATEEYVKQLELYESVNIHFQMRMDDAMLNLLNEKLEKINAALQKIMYDYYAKKLGKSENESVTVLETVQNVLLEMNYKADLNLTGDEALFQINEITLEKHI